jgi:hypothetical protein
MAHSDPGRQAPLNMCADLDFGRHPTQKGLAGLLVHDCQAAGRRMCCCRIAVLLLLLPTAAALLALTALAGLGGFLGIIIICGCMQGWGLHLHGLHKGGNGACTVLRAYKPNADILLCVGAEICVNDRVSNCWTNSPLHPASNHLAAAFDNTTHLQAHPPPCAHSS